MDSNMDTISNGMSSVDLNDIDRSAEANGSNSNNEDSELPMNVDYDMAGVPNTIIVTNIAESIFNDANKRQAFECMFKEFDPTACVQYLKSFRRARVVFESPLVAAKARIHFQAVEIDNQNIKCYFAQPVETEESSSPTLHPPQPTKQFLISPPASPPVGWEPVQESEPIINYDLLSAMAGLAPGESHELHPPSKDHPAIVVHICEDPAGFEGRPKIIQTRRPDVS